MDHECRAALPLACEPSSTSIHNNTTQNTGPKVHDFRAQSLVSLHDWTPAQELNINKQSLLENELALKEDYAKFEHDRAKAILKQLPCIHYNLGDQAHELARHEDHGVNFDVRLDCVEAILWQDCQLYCLRLSVHLKHPLADARGIQSTKFEIELMPLPENNKRLPQFVRIAPGMELHMQSEHDEDQLEAAEQVKVAGVQNIPHTIATRSRRSRINTHCAIEASGTPAVWDISTTNFDPSNQQDIACINLSTSVASNEAFLLAVKSFEIKLHHTTLRFWERSRYHAIATAVVKIDEWTKLHGGRAMNNDMSDCRSHKKSGKDGE